MDVRNHVNMGNAVLVLIVNLLVPGLGTILLARCVTMRRVLVMQNQVTDPSKKIKTSLHYHVT